MNGIAQPPMTILNRLRSAESGSRELDAEIMFDLFAKPVGKWGDGGPVGYLWPENNPSWNFGMRFPDMTKERILAARKRIEGETLIIERDGANVLVNAIRVPLVSTSIDAALALVERMLPSDLWRVEKISGVLADQMNASYWATLGKSAKQESAYGKTAPLAILTALFTALEAKDTKRA